MSGIDAKLVAVLLKGEFCLNGFRYRDLRDAPFGWTTDLNERRRQYGRNNRLLRPVRDAGPAIKVARTHRY